MKRFTDNLFGDYYITPAQTTLIEHRTECNPYDENGMLPLFTAPMASVVDDKNYEEFLDNNIYAIIPRTVSLEKRLELVKKGIWIAMGLQEFENYITNAEIDYIASIKNTNKQYICVDVANGHMLSLIRICKRAKQFFGDKLIIMAGNVANAATYCDYAKAGIDYIRIGIGTGSGCATSDKTGIGIELRDVLNSIHSFQQSIKRELERNDIYKSCPKVVLDGGCKSIRDVILALALGADYVMCGYLFAKTKEAAGEIILGRTTTNIETLTEDADNRKLYDARQISCYKNGRIFYGMSTERAQSEMGNSTIKPSEGKEFWVPIEYTINEWVIDFIASLRSTMSYCDATDLFHFHKYVRVFRNW